MRKYLAALLVAVLVVAPGAALAQARTFQFTADALDVDNGKKYGLTAQGAFDTDGGITTGGLTTYQLTGVRGGSVTFYNDYNPGESLRVAQIVGLTSFPPFFVPPQRISFAADGSLASADFTFDLSDFPNSLGIDTATRSAFFGGEGTQTLNSLQISEATAAVPEPAAWALMIVGFGAAGVVMRRRQAAVFA